MQAIVAVSSGGRVAQRTLATTEAPAPGSTVGAAAAAPGSASVADGRQGVANPGAAPSGVAEVPSAGAVATTGALVSGSATGTDVAAPGAPPRSKSPTSRSVLSPVSVVFTAAIAFEPTAIPRPLLDYEYSVHRRTSARRPVALALR